MLISILFQLSEKTKNVSSLRHPAFLRVIRGTDRFMLSTLKCPRPLWEGASSRTDDPNSDRTLRVAAFPRKGRNTERNEGESEA